MGDPPEKLPRRLRTICDVNPPTPRVPDLTEVTFIPMEAVGETGSLDLSRTRTASEVRQGYTGFADGDVLLAKITPCFENGKGALARDLLNGVGFGTTELHVLRLRDQRHDPRWLYYVTQSHNFRADGTASMYGAGGQKRVPPDFIRNFASVIPPAATQTAIANFLDRKTAAIDELMEKKRVLLTLLTEKRAALINQAVTKGLDPSVPMKDSGVPWIGEIPVHWTISRLGARLREAVAGPFGSSLTKAMYSDSGYKVYGQQQVIPDDFSIGDYYISEQRFRDLHRFEVRPRDLLVSVMGTVGRAAVVPANAEPGIINPRLVILRLDEQLTPSFARDFVRCVSGQAALRYEAQGATMEGLNLAILKRLAVPLPSRAEQDLIADHVGRTARVCDGLSRQIVSQIEALQEYRQALITAAVTGQLDIEGAA